MHVRHQLPVYSPVSLGSVSAAIAGSFTEGDTRRKLESLLREDFAAGEALLCGSGTQALQVALECARAERGPNALVALPGFSCFDVASAAVGARVPVTLYDLEPDSLAPDRDSLQRALDQGAQVVVVAHLYGIPVDWQPLRAMAAAAGALMIEDAAQGYGATYRGSRLGALGDISTLSFGRGKGWTGGSGGAVLFRGQLRSRQSLPSPSSIATMRSTAALAAQLALGRPWLYGVPRAVPGLGLGETLYHDPRAVTAMSTAAAAAILSSRPAAEREVEIRRANAKWLGDQLTDHSSLRAIAAQPSMDASYLRFPVLARFGMRSFDADLATRAGISASYPKPLSQLGPLRQILINESRLAGADRLAAELITLPVHSQVTDRDRATLLGLIRAYGRAETRFAPSDARSD